MKRDTTSEAAAVQDAWWAARSETERAEWWFRQQHAGDLYRYREVAKALPGASEPELMAAWFVEKFQGRLPAPRLASIAASFRAMNG